MTYSLSVTGEKFTVIQDGIIAKIYEETSSQHHEKMNKNKHAILLALR